MFNTIWFSGKFFRVFVCVALLIWADRLASCLCIDEVWFGLVIFFFLIFITKIMSVSHPLRPVQISYSNAWAWICCALWMSCWFHRLEISQWSWNKRYTHTNNEMRGEKKKQNKKWAYTLTIWNWNNNRYVNARQARRKKKAHTTHKAREYLYMT